MPPPRKYRINSGFTLAEVLITLGIIGVVTTLTIPSLIQKQKEKVAHTQLKAAYSTFSQAYLMAVNENGPIEYWDIGNMDSLAGAKKLYEFFKPFLLKAKDCNRSIGCFGIHYKALFGSEFQWQPDTNAYYAAGILSNGTSYAFWSGGTGCKYEGNGCGTIVVDINGHKLPNKAGVDFFVFKIQKNNLVPFGMQNSQYPSYYGEICEYKNTSKKNGRMCTAYFLEKGSMDYLHKDISDFWQ